MLGAVTASSLDLGPVAQLKAGRLPRRLTQLDRRTGPVRRDAGDADPRDARQRPVGRTAPGDGDPPADQHRDGRDRDEPGRAAPLDPAARAARPRDDRQLDRRRARGRPGPVAARRPGGDVAAGRTDGRWCGAQRAGDCPLHRFAVRPWTTRRSDDRPAPAYGCLHPVGAHRPRGRRGCGGLAARWSRRSGHRGVRAGDRSARSADAAVLHRAAPGSWVRALSPRARSGRRGRRPAADRAHPASSGSWRRGSSRCPRRCRGALRSPRWSTRRPSVRARRAPDR